MRGSLFDTAKVPFIYLPFDQNYSPEMNLVARAISNPIPLVYRLRRLVHDVDENVPTIKAKTAAEDVGFFLYLLRAATVLLAVCGTCGLLLANLGIYGVVSYSVALRTKEIGIRSALGATPRAILKMIIVEGFSVILIGSTAGILITIPLHHAVRILSLGFVDLDIFTFVLVPLILAISIVLASYIPAKRASRLNSMDALRQIP